MNSHTKLHTSPESIDKISERRSKPRIYASFPLKVRGVDASGEAFDIDTVLDNIGSGGLYARLGRQIDRNTRVFIVVRLSTSPADSVPAMRVAVRGKVLRSEPQPDGSYGLAVEITRYRLL